MTQKPNIIKIVLGTMVQVGDEDTFEEFVENVTKPIEGLPEVETRELTLDCIDSMQVPSQCGPYCERCKGSNITKVWWAFRPARTHLQ